MHYVQLRSGRWFHYTNAHGEKVLEPAGPGEKPADFATRTGASQVSEMEGTGVRVVNANDDVVEDWAVRRSIEGAYELASALVERYHDR